MVPSLERVKALILSIEKAYTDFSSEVKREWDTQYRREMKLEKINKAQTTSELG